MNKKYVLAFLAMLIATVALAAGYERISKDQVIIGTGTSSDKSIEFDTALSPDAKLTADGSDGTLGYNKNNFSLGDGTTALKSFYFDTGASPNDPAIGLDASGNMSIDNATSFNMNTDTVNIGDGTAADQKLLFDAGNGGSNAYIGWDEVDQTLKFSNDGATVKAIGSGSGAGGGINILAEVNADFEEGSSKWTASTPAQLTIIESGTFLGKKSGRWDAASSGDNLVGTQTVLPGALNSGGVLCLAEMYYKGGDANIDFEVYNGTTALFTKTLEASTVWKRAFITFTCPSSGTLAPRLYANADSAQIDVDNFKIGTNEIFTIPDSRWPIYTNVEIGGVVCHDAGNVYTTTTWFSPRQAVDGTWLLDFSAQCYWGSDLSAGGNITVPGIAVRPAANTGFNSLSCYASRSGGGDRVCQAAFRSDETNIIRLNLLSTLTHDRETVAGTVVLNSKPTWATKTAPDVYLAGTVHSDQVVAKAYRSTNQSLGDGATDIIDFDTVTTDTNSGITTGASWKYTADEAGWYLVNTSARFSTASWTAGDSINLYIYKNNTLYNRPNIVEAQSSDNSGSQALTINGSQVMQLAVGDYIDIRLANNTGATSTIDGASIPYTYIDVAKIPSPLDVANAAIGFSTATETKPGLVPSYKYEELDISSSGNFNSAQPPIRIAKVGSVVTLTFPLLAHASGEAALSAAGFIPALYRPTSAVYNTYILSGTVMGLVYVNPAGTLVFTYRNSSLAAVAQTSTIDGGSISWVVDE